jgi:hypothetical protein
LKKYLEKPRNILKSIFNNSTGTDTVKETVNSLRALPKNPSVRRAFADSLVRKRNLPSAAKAYDNAAKLYLKSNLILQAIVSKSLEWRIARPSQQVCQSFYKVLHKKGKADTPLNTFFYNMSWDELSAMLRGFVRARIPAGVSVKKFGDSDAALYFIVSGILRETVYHPVEGSDVPYRKSKANLGANDIFGDAFPFQEGAVSQSDVETISRVEMVKIPKLRVIELCERYPNIEGLLGNLYQPRIEDLQKRASRLIRTTDRHRLPTKANIGIMRDDTDKWPLVLNGITRDISVNGTCVVLGVNDSMASPSKVIGSQAKITFSLPTAPVRPYISGKVVWSERIVTKGEKTVALGLHFDEFPEPDRGLLEAYCYSGDAEQNLLWSLWESDAKL